MLIVALIGTNISPWMSFFLQGAIVEKGVRLEDYRLSKWDVIIGCIITAAISFFVIVACAATLFKAGIPVNEVSEAAIALQPLAGKYASALFAFGFFNAAFFGACIIPISTAYYVCEGLGFEKGISKKFKEAPQFYVILSSMLLLGALVSILPNMPLIFLLLSSQVINGILIPFILIAILVLINNKKIMGEYVNSRIYNILAWSGSIAIILVTLLLIATTLFPNLF
jgi:Mn2+/Fe2+ NRAMP family transporter